MPQSACGRSEDQVGGRTLLYTPGFNASVGVRAISNRRRAWRWVVRAWFQCLSRRAGDFEHTEWLRSCGFKVVSMPQFAPYPNMQARHTRNQGMFQCLSRRAGDLNPEGSADCPLRQRFQCLSRRAGDSNCRGVPAARRCAVFQCLSRRAGDFELYFLTASAPDLRVSMPQSACGRFATILSRTACAHERRFQCLSRRAGDSTARWRCCHDPRRRFNASVGVRAI